MKRVRMIISAAVVFAVVGSALAFKKSNPNLLLCSASGVCIAQTTTIFSSAVNPPEIVNHPAVYTGTIGRPCDTQDCPRFNGKVYNNQ
jgi:hypothetical protein